MNNDYLKLHLQKQDNLLQFGKETKTVLRPPLDHTAPFDFVIITARKDNNFGQFIFPKSVLANKGIISKNGTGGKRGFRVYPPWDKALNKQAKKTQDWQSSYFLTINEDNSTDLDLVEKLFLDNDQ